MSVLGHIGRRLLTSSALNSDAPIKVTDAADAARLTAATIAIASGNRYLSIAICHCLTPIPAQRIYKQEQQRRKNTKKQFCHEMSEV